MDIKNYNPHVRRKVDPIILQALDNMINIAGGINAKYILEAFPALAKEYYPDFFEIKESEDLGIH